MWDRERARDGKRETEIDAYTYTMEENGEERKRDGGGAAC